MSIDRIPVGALVEIFNRRGEPVASGALLEEWTVSTGSSYKQVITDKAPDALNYLGAVMAQISDGRFGFSAEFKQFGAALWESTEVATFNFSLEFAMTYSGLEEVSKPIARLQRLVVPAEGNFGNLIPPGPTILDALELKDYVTPSQRAPDPDKVTVSRENNYNQYESLLSIRVGNMLFDKVVIKSAESTLSKFTDDNGYPIYGRVALVAQTMFIPTKKNVGNWFGS